MKDTLEEVSDVAKSVQRFFATTTDRQLPIFGVGLA